MQEQLQNEQNNESRQKRNNALWFHPSSLTAPPPPLSLNLYLLFSGSPLFSSRRASSMPPTQRSYGIANTCRVYKHFPNSVLTRYISEIYFCYTFDAEKKGKISAFRRVPWALLEQLRNKGEDYTSVFARERGRVSEAACSNSSPDRSEPAYTLTKLASTRSEQYADSSDAMRKYQPRCFSQSASAN